MRYIRSGGAMHPRPGSAEARRLAAIPNLVWRDAEQNVHVNPLSHVLDSLDGLLLDYTYVLRAVVRYRDLANWDHVADLLTCPGFGLSEQLGRRRTLNLSTTNKGRQRSSRRPVAAKKGVNRYVKKGAKAFVILAPRSKTRYNIDRKDHKIGYTVETALFAAQNAIG
jgi:hypothetical protein